METARLEAVHEDLVRWGVVEAGTPVVFTRRFRGALARAAAVLQEGEKRGEKPQGEPLRRQVEVALAQFTKGAALADHATFCVALHVSTLPEAVRRLLGV